MKSWQMLVVGIAGYLLLKKGGGLRAEWIQHDELTGEPMVPYSGRGRPRQFNSSETKRVGVLYREMRSELSKTKGHLWRPSKIRSFATMVRSEMNTLLNTQTVCDGKMANEDGVLVCSGDEISFAKWMSRQAKRKREAQTQSA